MPPVQKKIRKRPGHTVSAPPSFWGVNTWGPSWQVILSVGDGAVADAGEGVLYIGKLILIQTYLDLFSERARLALPWPLTSSQLNTASVYCLLDGLFQLFFAFSTFFVLRPFSHFFRFFVSSFLLFRLCLYHT